MSPPIGNGFDYVVRSAHCNLDIRNRPGHNSVRKSMRAFARKVAAEQKDSVARLFCRRLRRPKVTQGRAFFFV